jgi:hypothetical protein
MSQPSFLAPLYAWLRQGTKEVGQAVPALPSSIRVVEEPGTLANPTQQMVTEQSGTLNKDKSILDRFDSRSFEPGDHEIER